MKLVSKMRFHQRNTHFRLEHSVRKNRTTFPDVPGWARKFSANTTQKFLSYVLFLFLHEEGRICRTTLSGSDRTKKLNSNSPPQLEMVRNGPQSLDANDVMVNARGLPGGDVEDSNRPCPSFPGPLFPNESRCSAFDMEIIFHSRANETHFHKKDCAPSLILKMSVFGTRKWPIDRRIISGKAKWARDWAGLKVGAHYRNRKWEAKDFEKVYTVVCGTPNYLFWRRNLINLQTNTLTPMTS